MNGVVLWSCHAINLLQMSSGSISGLARYGNSITLPLPNLVAKLAIVLLSVLCSHYSTSSFRFCFFILLILSHSSACFWHLLCRHRTCICIWWQPTQSEHLPCTATCSLRARRLSSIDLILFLCACIIVHVDFSPDLRRLSRQEEFEIVKHFFYWQKKQKRFN